MFRQQKDWDTRENAFAAFTTGPLTDLLRVSVAKAEFTGVDDVPVRFVRVCAAAPRPAGGRSAPAASRAT